MAGYMPSVNFYQMLSGIGDTLQDNGFRNAAPGIQANMFAAMNPQSTVTQPVPSNSASNSPDVIPQGKPAKVQIASADPNFMPDMTKAQNATASIESGGRYDALGPVTKTGDRAYGKYQIMGANIPEWSKEVLGQPVSVSAFLADPKLQDTIYNAKFGQYMQKYGPEGAARAWFAGEGGMNDPNRKDQLGTSVADYGQRFAQAYGGGAGGGGGQQQSAPVQMAQTMPSGQPTYRPSMEALQAGLMNPYTKALAEKLIAQQLAQQQKAYSQPFEMNGMIVQRDGNGQLHVLQNTKDTKTSSIMEYEYGQKNPGYKEAQAGNVERSLTPVYGLDKDGNTVILQTGKDGTVVQSKLPEGVKLAPGFDKIDTGTAVVIIDKRTGNVIATQPKDIAGKEAQEEVGKAQGKAIVAMPEALSASQRMIENIDGVLKHPGLSGGTGMTGGIMSAIPGTQWKDFSVRVDQLKGAAFLDAFDKLRGGGAITEVEGKKATDAMARLNTAQTEGAFREALTELRGIIQSGQERIKARAGGQASAPSDAGQTQSVAKGAERTPLPAGASAARAVADARDALAKGAPKEAVAAELRKYGIDPKRAGID